MTLSCHFMDNVLTLDLQSDWNHFLEKTSICDLIHFANSKLDVPVGGVWISHLPDKKIVFSGHCLHW